MEHRLILSDGIDEIDFYDDPDIMLTNSDGWDSTADVSVSEYGGGDGGHITNCRMSVRYINIYGKFRKSGSVMRGKRRLNSICRHDKIVRLDIKSPLDVYRIYGVVGKTTIDLHSYPMTFAIPIICADPYFYSADVTELQLMGTDGLFEFLPEGTVLNDIIYGDSEGTGVYTAENSGDISVGFDFTATFNIRCENPVLYNATTGRHIRINTVFDSGDVLEICTRDNHKTVFITNGSGRVNGLKYMSADSDMFQLAAGENIVKFDIPGTDGGAAEAYMRFVPRCEAVT